MLTDGGHGACDRCQKVYNPFLGDRFWSGEYHETLSDGTTVKYTLLCNGCHRDVVRNGS